MNCLRNFLLFVIVYVIPQIKADTDNEPYECSSFGDPHVYTWHSKSMTPTSNQYQDCYSAGYYPLVKNSFAEIRVQVSKRLSIEVEMIFSNGTGKLICWIRSNGYDMASDDDGLCNNHGVTWEKTETDTGLSMSVYYARANFVAIIHHHYKNVVFHYNIVVWQPKYLATRSTGICTKSDPNCNPTRLAAESEAANENNEPNERSLDKNQIDIICKTYVNTFLNKRRRVPQQRSAILNNTISSVLAGCTADLIFTGYHELARSGMDILMTSELTDGMTSIDTIQTAIRSNMKEALIALDEAAWEAEVEVAETFGFSTVTKPSTATTTIAMTTTTTRTTVSTVTVATSTSTNLATTTKPIPLATFKCAIYQDLYIQTWHPTDQASPPTRSCLGASGTYDLVRNKYVRYTLRTTGSTIDELTLVLLDAISLNAICTVTMVNENAGWMDCENHGIQPTLIKTATHETLTVYYARANFTTIVTRDIGINVGRFNINVYQEPELALQSAGICNAISSCNGAGRIK